jgi:hypothetical protein
VEVVAAAVAAATGAAVLDAGLMVLRFALDSPIGSPAARFACQALFILLASDLLWPYQFMILMPASLRNASSPFSWSSVIVFGAFGVETDTHSCFQRAEDTAARVHIHQDRKVTQSETE